VLPFANLSGDRDNEYFSDGLADEIITLLTRIPRLQVTARTSSFAFRGRTGDIREIGRLLGVNALLEGSVQRSAGRIRVSAQLVDAGTGFHLWSDYYDGQAHDVFAVQDQIAHAIARALHVRLDGTRRKHTPHLEAYNLWLKGRYFQHYETLDAVSRSKACLEQAIEVDPGFPLPYVSLADQLRHSAVAGIVQPRETITRGRAAVRHALELDDSLGEAHALSGAYRAWADFDWSGGAADFDRALELSPAAAAVHTLRAAYLLVPTGRLLEAEEEVEQAVGSDPVSPLTHIELGKVLLWARQFDRAQARLESAYELRPDHPLAEWYRGVGLYFQGDLAAALSVFQSAMGKVGPNPAMTGAIGMALGYLGRHDEARAALDALDSFEARGCAPRVSRAQVYLGLGEFDSVFHWLDRAVADRDPATLDLPCKPIWDPVRADLRFSTLLRRMHLE
jgi:TolB-like protein